MARGFSLIELSFVLCIIALLASIGLRRLQPFLDRMAADRAARDVTTALAVARHGAVLQGMRARLTIDADSLRIDRLEPAGWTPWRRWLGPAALRGDLAGSNPKDGVRSTGVG